MTPILPNPTVCRNFPLSTSATIDPPYRRACEGVTRLALSPKNLDNKMRSNAGSIRRPNAAASAFSKADPASCLGADGSPHRAKRNSRLGDLTLFARAGWPFNGAGRWWRSLASHPVAGEATSADPWSRGWRPPPSAPRAGCGRGPGRDDHARRGGWSAPGASVATDLRQARLKREVPARVPLRRSPRRLPRFSGEEWRFPLHSAAARAGSTIAVASPGGP